MKVNEFLKLIDLESINGQEITIIIPLKEKLVNGEIQDICECSLSENEKVIFSSDENSIYEIEKYENFGIEPCFMSEDENSPDYETIDVRESNDFYQYILSEYGEVWVVIS